MAVGSTSFEKMGESAGQQLAAEQLFSLRAWAETQELAPEQEERLSFLEGKFADPNDQRFLQDFKNLQEKIAAHDPETTEPRIAGQWRAVKAACLALADFAKRVDAVLTTGVDARGAVWTRGEGKQTMQHDETAGQLQRVLGIEETK